MGARKKLALEQFNRDNILTAARELFETKGVQDTTMDDIALQADYSKSTIYVYFRSKEDIYNSIVVDYLDILIGEMTVYIEGDTSFEDSYYKLCERLVSFCERYPKYYASLMFEEKATNSRKQGTVILPEILQELYGLMEALVQKGKNTNVLQETLDTKPTCCKNNTVKPVHDTAMSRNQLSVILNVIISLDGGCGQISNHRKSGSYSACHCKNKWCIC